MLIILEGCDGVGKTTIAERLHSVLSLTGDTEVMHKGPMAADALTEYEDPLEDYLPGVGHHIICDRWHVGEMVYGPLLRGENRMREHERRHIDKFLAARGAIVVHVLAPENEVRRRLGERGDDLIGSQHVGTIVDAYHRELTSHSWVTTNVNAIMTGREQDDREMIRHIVNSAAEIEFLTRQLTMFSTYVGPRNPQILLLGERRNGFGRRAAFVPVVSSSGAYLLQAVTNDVDTGAGLANACEEDVVTMYETLGAPLVVALGREAAKECERAEVPYGTVPHPQYVRRFHHDKMLEYGRAIREAAHHKRDMTHAFSHPSA